MYQKGSGGDVMVEQKKGHVKLTVEVEINEALMEIVKEGMKSMPQMMQTMRKMVPSTGKSKE